MAITWWPKGTHLATMRTLAIGPSAITHPLAVGRSIAAAIAATHPTCSSKSIGDFEGH